MLQFDIRVTVKEVNNDLQRVVEFDYHEAVRDWLQQRITTDIEDIRAYQYPRTFEFSVSDIKAVK